MVRTIVSKAFVSVGCEVHQASNGQEAVDLATKVIPDLIILDITMPVMDGLTALKEIREFPECQSVPVIMLTAESGKSSVDRARELNVTGYISKPFQTDDLLELARHV
ncbi:MAG: response regulator, partial [Verrucomicrobia bacterium]|nr:response regulator [Verrucomicrobiota bacterium]